MEKIIAREIEPKYTDFRSYFDGDCFSSRSGDGLYAIYVPETRNVGGYNTEEYNNLVDHADEIIARFERIREERTNCDTYKEAMEECCIMYNDNRCEKLKEWAIDADTGVTSNMAKYLSIVTNGKWNSRLFHGYSQGDCCRMIYCSDKYSEDSIETIAKFYLGCGSEFEIDGCGGYFVTDEIRWTEDQRLVDKLASEYGCKPEELEVHLYVGEHRVADYKMLNGGE